MFSLDQAFKNNVIVNLVGKKRQRENATGTCSSILQKSVLKQFQIIQIKLCVKIAFLTTLEACDVAPLPKNTSILYIAQACLTLYCMFHRHVK